MLTPQQYDEAAQTLSQELFHHPNWRKVKYLSWFLEQLDERLIPRRGGQTRFIREQCHAFAHHLVTGLPIALSKKCKGPQMLAAIVRERERLPVEIDNHHNLQPISMDNPHIWINNRWDIAHNIVLIGGQLKRKKTNE